MKKFFVLTTVLVAGFFTLGCFFFAGPNRLVSMTMMKSNGTIPPQYQFEETVKLVPDYDNKILKMDCSRVYPYRDEETMYEDTSSKGEIGNEYFLQFEKIIELLKDENIYKVETMGCTGGSTIDVEQVFEDGTTKKGSFYMCGQPGANIKVIEDFYENLVKTVSEDVY